MDREPAHWIAALGASHERLRSLVEPLSAEQLKAVSYASEWSIAQVLSHLGSGADIFSLFLDAGLTGASVPGREQFEPIWAAWNSKSPTEIAVNALVVDAAFVERISSLDPAERDGLHIAMFGMDVDTISLLRMRLGEHAVHTWDIAVALDPAATVTAAAVALLVDTLGDLVARLGKSAGEPQRVLIRTTEPDREFLLDVGESMSLAPADGRSGLSELRITAEGLLRLVYGRLNAGHTPAGTAGDADLDALRGVFPGF